MRICSYCGRENPDDTALCSECGTAYHFEKQPTQAAPLKPSQEDVSLRAKWGLYCIAWLAVVLAILAINPAYFFAAHYFPIGLVAMLPKGDQKAVMALSMGPIYVGIGWMFYAGLSLILSRTKRKSAFSLVYIFFCILLALNVAGCNKMLKALAKIE